MDLKIALSGDLPARCSDALAALAPELGMVPAAEGVPVRGHRGAALAVCCDGASVTIEWAQPIQFYRALSLLPRPLAACDIREEPCFETVGMMFDTSRNAVLRPDTLRSFLRKMALMGMNLGMMYTEDTYEVPGQPYFGYQRGRYTYEELHALDDYADMLGIELCPCVQTLGHLNRALHWPAMRRLQDNDEVLLADSEETYSFLRQILTAASAPYRSKRIHIGMDEAHGVGMGAHLRLHGYEKPYDILRRHLKRVLDIVNELGLSPMMWSDMYFRLESPTNGYYDGPMPSQQAVDAVVPGVELVYWDYYHMREAEYDEQLKKHDALHAPTVFAGGIWTWCGPAPDYDKTRTATLAGLSACRKAGVPLVFATAWGDNGAEANLYTALLGMQMFAEFTYHGSFEDEWLAQRMRVCCQADARAFWDLTLFNHMEGMRSGEFRPVNAAKMLLYQDPLVQLFTKDTQGFALSRHYAALAPRYEAYTAEGGAFAPLWQFYAMLADVLAKKCVWHEQASQAVVSHDTALAKQLADGLTETIGAVEALRLAWLSLWNATNKPHGFEVIDGRLGGVAARLDTAQRRMRAFAAGECDTIRFGYPIGEYTSVGIGYRLERYDLYNVDADASPYISDYKGTNWTSAISARILRDTTDDRARPTKGTIARLWAEYGGGGLGGTDNFIKAVADWQGFWSINPENTFHLRARVGGVFQNTSSRVPVFERFWLGGMDTVRGYSYSDLSPRDDKYGGDQIGGDRMGVLNVEYIWTFQKDMGLALVPFFDAGFNIDHKTMADDFNDKIVYSAGLELRWRSPMGDLRLAYGYPLSKDYDGEREQGRLEFSMGQFF